MIEQCVEAPLGCGLKSNNVYMYLPKHFNWLSNTQFISVKIIKLYVLHVNKIITTKKCNAVSMPCVLREWCLLQIEILHLSLS
jgi:hypothetical protein